LIGLFGLIYKNGECWGNKNGFQAAIPETLRSAARVKIKTGGTKDP
jgi:hypothetical protein